MLVVARGSSGLLEHPLPACRPEGHKYLELTSPRAALTNDIKHFQISHQDRTNTTLQGLCGMHAWTFLPSFHLLTSSLPCPSVIFFKNHSREKKVTQGTSLVVQWLRLHAPCAGGPGSIPGQGTRFHMLQLRVCTLQVRLGAVK